MKQGYVMTRLYLTAFLSMFFYAGSGSAQTVTGNLDGHITDAAGGVVVGAQVVGTERRHGRRAHGPQQ